MLQVKSMHLKYWNKKTKSTIYLSIEQVENINIKKVRHKPTVSLERKHIS